MTKKRKTTNNWKTLRNKITNCLKINYSKEYTCLSTLFYKQISFQQNLVLKKKIKAKLQDIGKIDDLENYKYQILAMVEELGEVMKADKRWKSIRNTRFNQKEKQEELVDVFITFINMCIFSGISADTLYDLTYNKIEKNMKRLSKEKK